MPAWRRHLFYTKKCVKTTWKLRVGLLVAVVLTGALTRELWIGTIGWSLVCMRDIAPSDVILVENFDPDYLLFERAAELEKAGRAQRVLVPVQASPDPMVANLVSKGVAELMAQQARIGAWEMVPIREAEPISLNAAFQIREHLVREHVKSLIVVAPGFRSRRSALVYRAVLGDGGTQVRCDPVFGRTGPQRWAETWHGVQSVGTEFLKLQYYRFYVLPFFSWSGDHRREQPPR
jgi:hypothetical protein